MTAVTSVTLSALNNQTISALLEKTSIPMANAVNAYLAIFGQVYNYTDNSTSSSTNVNGNLTGSIAYQIAQSNDAATATNSINNLINLAKNGMKGNAADLTTGPVDGSPTRQYYMTVEMTGQLSSLISSLQAVGVKFNSNGVVGEITTAQLQAWRALAAQTPTIQQMLSSFQAYATYANRSLQALTEVVYVKTANEVIGDTLTSLETALSNTQDALNTLSGLLNLHNQVTVTNSPAFGQIFSYDDTNDLGAFNKAYQILASIYFGSPIVPELASNLVNVTQAKYQGTLPPASGTVPAGFAVDNYGNLWMSLNLTDSDQQSYLTVQSAFPSGYNGIVYSGAGVQGNWYPLFSVTPGAGFPNALKQLLIAKQSLMSEIAILSQLTPTTTSGYDGSLLGRLKAVLSDINTNLVYTNTTGSTVAVTFSTWATNPSVAFLGFRGWMLDNYQNEFSTDPSAGGQAGAIDQNLNTAVTAGQSLNSSQQENVRNYLFVFQQYYQSASAILQALSDMITKFAQNISRS